MTYQTRTRSAAATLALTIAVGVLAGCSGSRSFVNPEADLSYYERVGVLPFATLGPDRLAGDKMASVVTTHLLVSRRFEVAEPGIFLGAYVKHVGSTNAPPIGLTQDKLTLIANDTGVQGIIEGTVRDFDYTRDNPPRPMISIEVRLVDCETGRIVWSTGVTRRGGPSIPLFNLGGTRTLPELAEEIAAELVDRLPR